jgi:hypothetical protein
MNDAPNTHTNHQTSGGVACPFCKGEGKLVPVGGSDLIECAPCDGCGILNPTAADVHRVRGKAYETHAVFFDLTAKVARLELRIYGQGSVHGEAAASAARELQHSLAMADRYRELAAAQFALAMA